MSSSASTECVVGPNLVSFDTLNAAANIVGGDFSVLTVNSSTTTFNGSTLNIQNQWNSLNDQLFGATANIMSGALLFLNGGTLYANGSTLYDIGQIELMNGATINFSSGTNQLTITSNAQFTSIGNNSVFSSAGSGNALVFDNNGFVQTQNGTLFIESDNIFWTNSLGRGFFTNITSNAVLEINGPFAVQTNCTNFINGPGTFLLYNGIETTINGLLQVGLADPSPGTLDYHAFTLDGSGSVNISGSPGLPGTLIWESGTFAGPQVNIDSNSLLIISNIFLKTISGCTINNAGAATWLTDGDTIQMDNGAVFNNLAGGTFTAENSAYLQGGAGASPSFFYNAGTFRKSVSSNPMNFAPDNPPAPSPYFLNLGLLDVQTGTLYMEWGTNSGQCNVATGAQLLFWQGTNVQESTATFTGAGLYTIYEGDFWLAADQVMTNNLVVLTSGRIDGPGNLTMDGVLTLDAGAAQGAGSLNVSSTGSLLVISNNFTLYRNITNAGRALISNVAVYAGQPLTWNNLPGSSLNLMGAAYFGNTVGYVGPPPALYNAGALSNSGPANLTAQINWNVTNSGLLVVNPYSMIFEQQLTQTAGATQVQPGATLTVSGAFGHTFDMRGGVLEGTGTVSGSVVNSGTIHPGDSPGILTIGFGTLTNDPGAQLAVDIAGTAPGLQFSQLSGAGGQAWLNNLGLTVNFDGGFVPTVGQSFVIWTNAQINGVFASLAGNPAGGVVLVPQYSPNLVTLVAANNPSLQSPSFTDKTLSFGFQTTTGLTNIVQYTTSLSPPDWQPLTNIVGDGLVHFFTDNKATNASRYYRVGFK